MASVQETTLSAAKREAGWVRASRACAYLTLGIVWILLLTASIFQCIQTGPMSASEPMCLIAFCVMFVTVYRWERGRREALFSLLKPQAPAPPALSMRHQIMCYFFSWIILLTRSGTVWYGQRNVWSGESIDGILLTLHVLLSAGLAYTCLQWYTACMRTVHACKYITDYLLNSRIEEMTPELSSALISSPSSCISRDAVSPSHAAWRMATEGPISPAGGVAKHRPPSIPKVCRIVPISTPKSKRQDTSDDRMLASNASVLTSGSDCPPGSPMAIGTPQSLRPLQMTIPSPSHFQAGHRRLSSSAMYGWAYPISSKEEKSAVSVPPFLTAAVRDATPVDQTAAATFIHDIAANPIATATSIGAHTSIAAIVVPASSTGFEAGLEHLRDLRSALYLLQCDLGEPFAAASGIILAAVVLEIAFATGGSQSDSPRLLFHSSVALCLLVCIWTYAVRVTMASARILPTILRSNSINLRQLVDQNSAVLALFLASTANTDGFHAFGTQVTASIVVKTASIMASLILVATRLLD